MHILKRKLCLDRPILLQWAPSFFNIYNKNSYIRKTPVEEYIALIREFKNGFSE